MLHLSAPKDPAPRPSTPPRESEAPKPKASPAHSLLVPVGEEQPKPARGEEAKVTRREMSAEKKRIRRIRTGSKVETEI